MTKQKKGFWTFVFSLIPGAGEMHMGFMKQGISIMAVFWGLIGLSSFFETSAFVLGLPLLWFYSFFNVHNLKSLTEEEFYSLQDDYAFHLEVLVANKKDLVHKYHNMIAAILIFIGLTILWNNSYRLFRILLPDYFANIIIRLGDMLPQIVLGIAIIMLGISMVRGKKKELEDNESA
ncbi:hypothetical protein C8E03_101653 [Lachnotalea glycerini]|jgi:hypothetical protein|uniref:TM2 domain-containing protein n=1 Tax=Lachnotalea glycerini TaxID=1763509 RepID=A0A255IKD3_9FIRM|nr:hypothetical protein [Lachnotalea glycerini]PXV96020.1 hypothetical protein C8E03_101653 [Lachnotalea glycerini]RDY30198.1 hypothetical protein CG710_016005 [Lachnotalea glycerini]